MDSENKTVLIVCGSFVTVLLSVFGLMAYGTHLRSSVINNSPDPLYAACAFDSDGKGMPPSCVALLSQPKELPR
jgi:hypothetical protein